MHYPGNNAGVSWTSVGATGVTLLIDGGLYGTYGANGSASLPFACNNAPNTQQTHTYTLTTTPPTLNRTITASALVNEITDVGSGGSGASPPPASASASP